MVARFTFHLIHFPASGFRKGLNQRHYGFTLEGIKRFLLIDKSLIKLHDWLDSSNLTALSSRLLFLIKRSQGKLNKERPQIAQKNEGKTTKSK